MSLETLQAEIAAGNRDAVDDMRSFAPAIPTGLGDKDPTGMRVGIAVLHINHRFKQLDEAFTSAMKGELKAIGRYTAYARSLAPLLAFEKGLLGHEDEPRMFKLKKRIKEETLLLATFFAGRLPQEEAWVVTNFLMWCREFVSSCRTSKQELSSAA